MVAMPLVMARLVHGKAEEQSIAQTGNCKTLNGEAFGGVLRLRGYKKNSGLGRIRAIVAATKGPEKLQRAFDVFSGWAWLERS